MLEKVAKQKRYAKPFWSSKRYDNNSQNVKVLACIPTIACIS